MPIGQGPLSITIVACRQFHLESAPLACHLTVLCIHPSNLRPSQIRIHRLTPAFSVLYMPRSSAIVQLIYCCYLSVCRFSVCRYLAQGPSLSLRDLLDLLLLLVVVPLHGFRARRLPFFLYRLLRRLLFVVILIEVSYKHSFFFTCANGI